MTNEEFRIKNGELSSQMADAEKELFNTVRKMIPDVNLPEPSQTFSIKLDELFETFENDPEPLDQHLTIIVGVQFMLAHCSSIVGNVDGYVRSLLESAAIGDSDGLRSLLELKPDVETLWAEKDKELLELDWQKDLGKVIDGVKQLPQGIPKFVAQEICSLELQRANYKPKKGPKMGY